MKMLKKICYAAVLCSLLLISGYFFAVYENNRQLAAPSGQQFRVHLDRAIDWLLAKQDAVLRQDNPVLWWMLQESYRLTGNEKLNDMLVKYHQRYPYIRTGAWGALFGGKQYGSLDDYAVLSLPYYNQHMLFALNCAARLVREVPSIERQNHADFCAGSHYFFRPACVTHQLMGVYFMEQNSCGLVADLPALKASLQDKIMRQLIWDIRVVDVYLQRVLMLYITGTGDKVKTVWLSNIIDNQYQDGSWGDYQELLSLNGLSVGFSSGIVSMAGPSGNFHTTVQGIYLLAYILSGAD